MLRRIIYTTIILLGLYIFYRQFIAPTIEPFFQEKAGNVDLLQLTIGDQKTEAIIKEEEVQIE